MLPPYYEVQLVGGFNPSEKYTIVKLGGNLPQVSGWTQQKSMKPPTRFFTYLWTRVELVHPQYQNWTLKTLDNRKSKLGYLLLMAEIPNNHLGCVKPCKEWEKLPINWCRISAINRRKGFCWCPPKSAPFKLLDLSTAVARRLRLKFVMDGCGSTLMLLCCGWWCWNSWKTHGLPVKNGAWETIRLPFFGKAYCVSFRGG